VHHLSYFSRMSSAVTFADLAEVEMRRRAVIRAKEVCAVTDGADWLQGFVDLHRPDAVRILDFPHAAEHVSLLLQALQAAGLNLPADPAVSPFTSTQVSGSTPAPASALASSQRSSPIRRTP